MSLAFILKFAKLRMKSANLQVSGFVGRRTSFEVKVNDEEIHSKLKTSAFPDFDEVVQICIATVKGSPPTQVQKVHKASCNIL